MPNYCAVDVTVYGEAEAVEKAIALLVHLDENEEPAIDFNRLIPYPAKFAEQDESASRFFGPGLALTSDPVELARRDAAMAEHVARYGSELDGYNSGGYEWCRKNWGVKWAPDGVQAVRYAPGKTIVSFRTPWTTPDPVLDAFASSAFQVEGVGLIMVEYFESGMAFAGGWSYLPATGADRVAAWHTNDYKGSRGG